MAKYLIDVNLPYRFSLWSGTDYLHVFQLNDAWTDSQIWHYAQEQNLTIVTKDTDFSDRIILSQPPPRVIHICVGNMKIRDFHQLLHHIWGDVCRLSSQCKLVRVYQDRLEGIE